MLTLAVLVKLLLNYNYITYDKLAVLLYVQSSVLQYVCVIFNKISAE